MPGMAYGSYGSYGNYETKRPPMTVRLRPKADDGLELIRKKEKSRDSWHRGPLSKTEAVEIALEFYADHLRKRDEATDESASKEVANGSKPAAPA